MANAITVNNDMTTTEGRIREAARLFWCFYAETARKHAAAKGISQSEMATGAKLADLQMRNTRRSNALFGTPCYGTPRVSQTFLAECAAAERAILDAHAEQPEPAAAPAHVLGCPF